jgi:predicted DNA binding CopG/RHH family protein
MKVKITNVDPVTRQPLTDQPEESLEIVDLVLAPADLRRLKKEAARDGLTTSQLITRIILSYLDSLDA